MQLHISPTSPYARKVRIAVRLLGLENRIEERVVDPWNDPGFRAVNPLSQVPALVRDDGSVLFDSLVIVDYLDGLRGTPRLVPRDGPARTDVLASHALAQGVTDATVRIVVERRRRESADGAGAILRHQAAIDAALAHADTAALPSPGSFDDVGAIALASALGYLDFRLPALAWRTNWPHLADWFGAAERLPVFEATRPPA